RCCADTALPRPVVARLATLKRELAADAYLPYARHVTDTVVALDGGALALSFRLGGASFETADVRDLNDRHGKLNSAWRNLADERLAIWHHLVRREETGRPAPWDERPTGPPAA